MLAYIGGALTRSGRLLHRQAQYLIFRFRLCALLFRLGCRVEEGRLVLAEIVIRI